MSKPAVLPILLNKYSVGALVSINSNINKGFNIPTSMDEEAFRFSYYTMLKYKPQLSR